MLVYDDCVGWYDGVEVKTRNRQVGVHGDGKKAGGSGKKLGWVRILDMSRTLPMTFIESCSPVR